MKILHVVPSVFNYFSDIRERALMIIEGLDTLGLQNEVITLQFTPPSRAEQFQLKQVAPSRKYVGESNIKEIEAIDFENCDLLHVHAPFFGVAGKILKWKNKHPNKPLVVSYYRDVNLTDLFSFFVRVYNLFYLPKIFKMADAITLFPDTNIGNRMNKYFSVVEDKVLLLSGGKVEGQDVTLEDIVRNLDLLYNNLIN